MSIETDDKMQPSPLASTCRRCGVLEARHLVRQETLCQPCFERYFKTKIIKRLEAFRGRKSNPAKRRRWLLPISFGSCSSSLLHVLDDHLQRQISKSGLAEYELHCLHVSPYDSSTNETDAFGALKSRYPRHSYTTLPLTSKSELERSVSSDHTAQEFSDGSAPEKPFSLESPLSASSQVDLTNILLYKTLVNAAQNLGCEGILLGHCTTRLAEKILAETAKGRGLALPEIVNDHLTPQGVWIFYPMKDVLKKEVLQYARSLSLPAADNVLHNEASRNPVTPVKNSSIDSLMSRYFQSVEENYPSIVANVVRTSGKLQSPNSTDLKTSVCALCEIRMADSTLQEQQSSTRLDNSSQTRQSTTLTGLCGACEKLAWQD